MRTDSKMSKAVVKKREEWEDTFLRLFAPSLIGVVPKMDAWDPMSFFDFE
ncbi:MAG: hypothetical protein LKE33_08100 [Acidaminococcus sp.]|jgi:hypothetical protein|nr:hypothetical protein [Acidaminococcus sp.]